MTELKNSINDKTLKFKLWQNSKTKIFTTQKLKLWQNSKTQIKTKLNSNCENSKTQIVTKLNNSNCDKTQKLKFWTKNNFWQKSFVKNKLTPRQPMRCIWGSYLRPRDVFQIFCWMLSSEYSNYLARRVREDVNNKCWMCNRCFQYFGRLGKPYLWIFQIC